jgi:hypothetical protein
MFADGVQAIQWAVDDRGLAGLNDLQGLPWSMSMEQFFEAWVEAVAELVARRIGGSITTGRLDQTRVPLEWNPPFLGSQKSLVPDVILDRDDLTVIFDAKYKEHFEEIQDVGWRNLEDELRERHRADLLQVLAYANLFAGKRIIVCLAYPCTNETWASLRSRAHLFHRAMLNAGERRIDVILTAFPMGQRMNDIAAELAAELSRP